MKRETATALAVALAWGCCVSVAGYAIVRFIQFFLYPDPNPATLVWSAHAGFFWRCWTCAYAGALASFIAYVGAKRGPERAARSLVGAIATAAVLLALQVAVFP
jgi:choline-glycine betaine transporter